VANLPLWLAEARKQQQASGKPTLSVVVVYDLPNRDCAANSSAGELKVEENGAARYRTEFIDVIVNTSRLFRPAHRGHPEPDSLGNLVTNMNLPSVPIRARPTSIDGVCHPEAAIAQREHLS